MLAVLDRREQLRTRAWLQQEVQRRADDPADRLLVIFDVFDEWFRRRDFEGCFFVNALLEVDDRRHPVHRSSREQLARIRSFVAGLASEAGVADPEHFARQWHILMKGSIVSAGEGDVDAARRAKENRLPAALERADVDRGVAARPSVESNATALCTVTRPRPTGKGSVPRGVA